MATQKKTADVDYSMQEKILALYELQKIDSKIDGINKVKGELPLEVQDLEDEMAGMKTRIEHINAEIEELNSLTKQRKREVDQAKIMIGNYKEQQNNVRNNLPHHPRVRCHLEGDRVSGARDRAGREAPEGVCRGHQGQETPARGGREPDEGA